MQKRNLTTRQQGFTTVELMLVVVLVSILTLALYGAAAAMRRSFAQNTKNNYNLLAAKKGLSRIAEELRYATSMSAPAVNGPDLDKAIFEANNVSTTISFKDNSLQITKAGGGGSILIAKPFVKNVFFSRDKSRVTVTMEVQDSSSISNPALTLRTTIRMLNVAE